jgi:hypothetical protein
MSGIVERCQTRLKQASALCEVYLGDGEGRGEKGGGEQRGRGAGEQEYGFTSSHLIPSCSRA